MDPVVDYLRHLIRVLHGRLRELHDEENRERGSLTLEQVVIASVLFVAAVALVGVIVGVIKSYQGKITATGGQ